MTDADQLREIVDELDALNKRLEAGELASAEATELLERISHLAHEAAAALERQAEALEE
ncbi:MAG: hypothetical protein ACTHNU_18140 [Gaiellales bacterium]